jgi:hypothetical protein
MFPSVRNHFKDTQGSTDQQMVGDRIAAVGDVQPNRLQDQAAKLLSSPESSAMFRTASASTTGGYDLHHLELTDNANAPANQPEGLVMTGPQGHRMSHNEGALDQMSDDQVAQVAHMNPTTESMEQLVERNPQEAETMANQDRPALDLVMNNDNIDENFQLKMKRDVIGA